MEEKFAEFYAEIRLGQEDAAANALKRSRYEKPHEYKRKGNKQQAAFNAKLDEAVAKAKLQIEEAGPSKAPAVERSKEALKKGRLVPPQYCVWDLLLKFPRGIGRLTYVRILQNCGIVHVTVAHCFCNGEREREACGSAFWGG